jgi:hypothetical protein
MRFTIEIPDELFRASSSTSQTAVPMNTSDQASSAMNGGAGPDSAGGVAISLSETVEVFSAGPAEETVGSVARDVAIEADNNGGPAPQTAE